MTDEDKRRLGEYVGRLERMHVSELGRSEQKAYWINLYNALTAPWEVPVPFTAREARERMPRLSVTVRVTYWGFPDI